MKFLRKVTEMPWLEPGIPDDGQAVSEDIGRPKMVALTMFLAVATSIFFLFLMAYIERMALADWNPVKEPRLLWLNTAFLIIGSFAMQRTRKLAANGVARLNVPLLIGGLMAIAFLVGQYFAWLAMRNAGLYAITNPASAFFYLLTAIHGLHLLGGVYVWARTLWRSLKGGDFDRIRVSVDLCSVYWHYLLLVWLVLFALMLNT